MKARDILSALARVENIWSTFVARKENVVMSFSVMRNSELRWKAHERGYVDC